MADSRACRTLVKSPPEVWAKVSDAAELARHLGEFGEIRITRVEPETTVAWEGDRVRGTVELAQAGWGTRVTLTASTDEPEVVEEKVAPALAAAAPLEAVTTSPRDDPVDAVTPPAVEEPPAPIVSAPTEELPAEAWFPDSRPGPAPVGDAAPSVEPEAAPDPPVRRGWLMRLLGRRTAVPAAHPEAPRGEIPAPSPAPPAPAPPAPGPDPQPPTPAPDPGPPAPAPDPQPPAPAPAPEPPDPTPPGPMPDPEPPAPLPAPDTDPPAPEPAPEPPAAALADATSDPERTLAVLTAVLDDLGAAHHRPFSR